ncbi:hypothetical protein K469DRAFT_731904 [Zopfia rhizophila CBS 207.26]|uniref:MFS general substrate transporter n=1 Tax=Zopfia rhizophila CBS 207.26 TaxID=1314779 RepID=A0A6A6EIX2_9PEZI|nr:hypothetical protein K469DRAFT_731904 [Zopfia rhizophila CBS 207.26]
MSVGSYLASRFSTLKPPMDKAINPVTALDMLNRQQWLFFWVARCDWVRHAFDSPTVGSAPTPLAKDGFRNAYNQSFACRALFRIAMGGLYGNAVAPAIEDCPDQARGFISGLFQADNPAGYLLVTAFARALVNTTSHSQRPLFWFGACPPVRDATSSFVQQAKLAVKHHWHTLIYMVILMVGFNFMANLGAITVGISVGYMSEFLGCRLTITVACVVSGTLVHPYTYVTTPAVAIYAFLPQFFVQGAFGMIPSHLLGLSPNATRIFVVSTAYQLGNTASSPAATIQATIYERYYPLPPTAAGVKRYDYALVICAILGALAAS